MSHHNHDEPIICPNCGSEASGNFCAQCGQETHLHKDTFWGLVMHFLGHYFHYDSKFWKTMRTLWREPGKLTQAYMDKQRMRYIPPISLYIFISAAYFLISFSLHGHDIFPITKDKKNLAHSVRQFADKLDSLDTWGDDSARVAKDNKKKDGLNVYLDTADDGEVVKTVIREDSSDNTIDTSRADSASYFEKFFADKVRKIEKEHEGRMAEYVREKKAHTVPKVFFFMIPVLALILKILFRKRTSMSFVDHTVFAIHYHSFWFSLWLITSLGISNPVHLICALVFYTTMFSYMVIAMKRIYKIGITRAIANTILVAMGYGIAFAFVSFIVSAAILALE